MIPLNYNQLYYFYKIAKEGSISLASKAILISSPALSMQLKELEETLGTLLFLRQGRKLVLTESGAIVYEYAEDIFKLGFELRDTLGDRGKGKERLRIEIGCQDSVPKHIADDLVSFLIENKGCKVVLREGNRDKLLNLQNEYKLDIILTNSIPSVDNSLIYETKLLCREELRCFGHPKFRTLRARWPEALSGSPMIVPTYDSSVRHKLESFLKDHGLVPDVVAEVEDKATEVDLAVKGYGLILAMRSSVEAQIQANHLIEIGVVKKTFDEVWMIMGKRKILNPIALFAINNFSLEKPVK